MPIPYNPLHQSRAPFKSYRRMVTNLSSELVSVVSDFQEKLGDGASREKCDVAVDWLMDRIRDLDRELTSLRFSKDP
jgi:hypothetical protein